MLGSPARPLRQSVAPSHQQPPFKIDANGNESLLLTLTLFLSLCYAAQGRRHLRYVAANVKDIHIIAKSDLQTPFVNFRCLRLRDK